MAVKNSQKKQTKASITKEDTLSIMKEYQARRENGRFKKGEAKRFFEEASETYGISVATVKNICYDRTRYGEDFLKKMTDDNDKIEADKRLVDEVRKAKELLEKSKKEKEIKSKEYVNPAEGDKLEGSLESPALRPSKPPYKFGDVIEVEVYDITTYGAFCRTKDGYEYEGLLHISEIKNGFVNDVNDYFSIGDVIKLKYKNTSREGKISFTGKGMRIPLKSRTSSEEQKPSTSLGEMFGDKLSQIKSNINESQEEKAINRSMSVSKKPESLATFEEPKNELSLRNVEDDEMNEIVHFLNAKVGVLSPKAMYALRSVLGTTKLVTFTMKMMEVSKDFEPDLGYLLINEIKEAIDK